MRTNCNALWETPKVKQESFEPVNQAMVWVYMALTDRFCLRYHDQEPGAQKALFASLNCKGASNSRWCHLRYLLEGSPCWIAIQGVFAFVGGVVIAIDPTDDVARPGA